MANLFLAFEPLDGWRHAEATARMTSADFAHVIRAVVNEQYNCTNKIAIVLDNLSTHTPASPYKAFEAVEAQRLCARVEWH